MWKTLRVYTQSPNYDDDNYFLSLKRPLRGLKFKGWRQAQCCAKMSGKSFSRKIGVSAQSMSLIRNGKLRPSDETLKKMIGILFESETTHIADVCLMISVIFQDLVSERYQKTLGMMDRRCDAYRIEYLAEPSKDDLFFAKQLLQNDAFKAVLIPLCLLPDEDIYKLGRFAELILNSSDVEIDMALVIFESLLLSLRKA